MSATSAEFVPGSIHPLANSTKNQWELGQVRQIATGILGEDGLIRPADNSSWSWQLSIRSVEKAGSFQTDGTGQVLTLIAGDFLQLEIDGQTQGLEPLRPLKYLAQKPVATSQPAEELLTLHLATHNDQVRGTVRIVELSKKREQYLFDGQLGVLLQGAGVLNLDNEQHQLQLRDTVIGSDAAEPTITGRGFMAVVSLDLP